MYCSGLVCRSLPKLKVSNPNLDYLTYSFSEVPTPFMRGARAKEFGSSGLLVARPLESVLPAPGVLSDAESSLRGTHHMTLRKENIIKKVSDMTTQTFTLFLNCVIIGSLHSAVSN